MSTQDQPTQVRYTGRAVVRTFFQTYIPALLVLGVVVPYAVQVIMDTFGDVLPGWARAALIGTATVLAGLASILTKIMGHPKVEAFLRSKSWLNFLAAEPRPVPPVDVDPGAAERPNREEFQPGGIV